MEFEAFPKIHRYSRGIVISEKIDGTNAQIAIDEQGNIRAGSRTRWIAPGDDNYGFAKWVDANKEELLKLGVGRHFGEWWGNGIQRGYDQSIKHFSLFNAKRWEDPATRPNCCGVVPIIYAGIMNEGAIENALAKLALEGSMVAPGFMRPEGIIVYHSASNSLFKKTLDKDEEPKSVAVPFIDSKKVIERKKAQQQINE